MIKRKIIFLLISFFILISCNRNPEKTQITITGEIKKSAGVKVYFEQNGQRIDSAVVADGKFSVSGKVWNNAVADIWFNIKDENDPTIPMWSVLRLFLEHGNSYKIIADGRKALSNGVYMLETSSSFAQEHEVMVKTSRQSAKHYKALIDKFTHLRGSKDSFADTILYNRYDDSVTYYNKKLESVVPDAQKALIAKNPNSYLSLSVLSHFVNLDQDLNYFVKIEKQLTGKYRETYHAKEFIKALTKVRTDLPVKLEIDAVNVNNQGFKFGDYNNSKAIVIDFWATWCAPCVEVMPEALAVEKQLKAKNISYVFLSYDERIKTWKKASDKLGLQHSYRILHEAKPYLKEKLHIVAIPRYILMDNEGNVLVRDLPSPSDAKFMIAIDSAMRVSGGTR